MASDRLLTMRHLQHNERPVHGSAMEALEHVGRLWDFFGVRAESFNGKSYVVKLLSVPPTA